MPLSAAWHSASLQLPAQVRAKSTLIFLAGPSVVKQGKLRPTRDLTVITQGSHGGVGCGRVSRCKDVDHSRVNSWESLVPGNMNCSLSNRAEGGGFAAAWMGGSCVATGPSETLKALITGASNSLLS